MEVCLLSQVTSNSKKENSFKLCQERFKSDTRKKLFTERVIMHRIKLSREDVKPPSLEAFKKWMWCLGMWFSSELGNVRLKDGLDTKRHLQLT